MSSTSNISQAILNKARVNKFILILNLPEKLKDNQLFSIKELQFSVVGSLVPEIEINSELLKFSGQKMNIPGYTRNTYSDLVVKFKIDNEWKNYLAIYNWINLFNDDKESILDKENILDLNKINMSKKYQKLVATQTIIGLDEYNNRLIKFTYTDAYPTKLKNIDFDYTRGDEIDSSATFKFNQFIIETGNNL